MSSSNDFMYKGSNFQYLPDELESIHERLSLNIPTTLKNTL